MSFNVELCGWDTLRKHLPDSFLDELIDRETLTVEKAKLMSRNKTLQEQSGTLFGGPSRLARTVPKWILTG